MIKELVIFAAGAAIGAGVTVLIMRKKYDEKYNKLLKDAIDSDADFRLREADKKLAEAKAIQSGYIQSSGDEKPAEKEDKKVQKVKALDPTKHVSDKNSSGENKIGKPNYIDYTSYYEAKASSEYPRDEYNAAEQSALYEGERANEEAHSGKKPRIVSRGEYDSPEFEHHDRTTLYYYTEDDVLATEEDEVIEDPSTLIGDALDKFGFRNNGEEVIYVRNYGLQTDFEVEKRDTSFAESKWD